MFSYFVDTSACSVNSCHTNAICISTQGSISCICKNGYTGNGRSCTDIDECQLAPSKPYVQCTNLFGSYKCGTCPQGYLVGNVCQGNGIEIRNHLKSLFNLDY